MAVVTLIGVKGGPAIRPGSSMPTSHLLRMGGKRIVIDAGLGVCAGVIAQGVGLHEIDVIFITHLHSDHYLELGPMLHTAWTAGRSARMTVIGPSGLERYFAHFWAAMADDIDLRIVDEGRPDIRDLIDLHMLEDGPVEAITDLTVTAMGNDHPPISESYALRFDGGGKRIVFSGDTAYVERMIPFAQGADLLIHEAMLTAGIDALCVRVGNGDDRLKTHLLRSHCPAAKTGIIAREAGVKRMALNHLIPNDDPDFTETHWRAEVRTAWDGPLDIGKDGLTIHV